MGFTSLESFLAWMATSGAAGVGMAHLLDNLEWFSNLTSRQKFWLVLALSIAAPLAGLFGLALYTGTPVDANAAFLALQASVLVFASSQWAHNAKRVPEDIAWAELREAPDHDMTYRSGQHQVGEQASNKPESGRLRKE